MKIYTTIITTVLVATCVASTFAQGSVVFNNGTGLVWQQKGEFDPTLIPVPNGGGMVQLYWAPAGSPYIPWTDALSPSAWYQLNYGWSLGPVVGFTTPAAGKFNGGMLTLSPLAGDGSIDYVVIGWIGNAQSFDEAVAGYSLKAVSDRFTSATGNSNIIPPGLPVRLADSFGGLNIAWIPEPSGFALAVLGAATLLALRGRGGVSA